MIRALAFLLILMLVPTAGASAQARLTEKLKEEEARVRETVEQLELSISRAQERLRNLSNMKVEAREDELNNIFGQFRERIVDVLNRVDDNAEFMDILAAGEIQVVRLKAWFERQPADYPKRDSTIERLGRARQRLIQLKEDIRSQRDGSLTLLSEIGTAHTQAVQLAKVDLVDDAVNAVQGVVDNIKKLNERLKQAVSSAKEVIDASEAAQPVQ